MFTGIVEEVGRIACAEPDGGNLRVTVEAKEIVSDLAIGDSIAVSGCCLTVVRFDGSSFDVELSKETRAKTAPRWKPGAQVNLERAMEAKGRFGGHIVSGHVEGVGEVVEVTAGPGAFVMTVRAPRAMGRYLIPKGSITVDGVSLTVVDVGGPAGSREDFAPEVFSLWIIPHTLTATTLGALKAGSSVNLEADVVAKYLERLVMMRGLMRDPEPAKEAASPQGG